MSRLLTQHDETGYRNPCLCGILVVSKEEIVYFEFSDYSTNYIFYESPL